MARGWREDRGLKLVVNDEGDSAALIQIDDNEHGSGYPFNVGWRKLGSAMSMKFIDQQQLDILAKLLEGKDKLKALLVRHADLWGARDLKWPEIKAGVVEVSMGALHYLAAQVERRFDKIDRAGSGTAPALPLLLAALGALAPDAPPPGPSNPWARGRRR